MTATRSRGITKAPDAFRTISEVSDDLDVPQHVLRFWETRFSQLKPMKRSGGRRLYRPDHVALLRGIKSLLYDDGLTIKGVQKVLRESGSKSVIARGREDASLALSTTLPEETGILPLDLPDNAAERLASLRARVRPEAAPGPTVSAEKRAEIEGWIERLESLLVALEAPRQYE